MPTLLLQPLVENAIRHGLAAGPTPGRIDVRARTADGRLRIEVRDNGIGMGRNGAARRHGIGLENTRARLAQLYGAGGMLRVEEAEGGGVRAELELPLRAAPILVADG